MILADTSVWIEALRNSQSIQAEALRVLMDEDQLALAVPIRIEILSGASSRDLPRLQRSLSALPIWFPDSSTWDLMETWVEQAVPRGQRFGLGDLLIGAIAAENDGRIWSLDGDFQRMSRLGFVRLFSL